LTAPVQPSRPQLAVSGAIFRDGKILLVRRAHSPGNGLYSLPGGRVEFGESLHAALQAAGGGRSDVCPSVAARRAAREVVLNDDHNDFKWLSPDALGDLKVTGGLHEVITAARRLI
jgi:8-oxo-dGTP pyrophosphatase MutT (NUDIX family)